MYKLQVDDVTRNNKGQVYALISSSSLQLPSTFSKLVYFQDIPMGCVVAEEKKGRVSILVLMILDCYVGLGGGSMLLQTIIDHYSTDCILDKVTEMEIIIPIDYCGWFEKKGFKNTNVYKSSWFGEGVVMLLHL
jgi:hypothetical protein